ncbi:hypothetical protein [Methylocystis echinoides]|uniref:Uncharacterized protein n=1 Tax=Methylocystis echinoides TaxID=29468 RepID=A0A9W6LUU1_9HYPH|nr:hypothetical protein [Methylocystis echinoides]GLI95932.1 hypothetical protein LMG27198_49240 [Methylocystis echinoides]
MAKTGGLDGCNGPGQHRRGGIDRKEAPARPKLAGDEDLLRRSARADDQDPSVQALAEIRRQETGGKLIWGDNQDENGASIWMRSGSRIFE